MGTWGKLARSVRAFTRELARVPAAPIEAATPNRPTIGLALGGGFARGLAHIGVLKVFEEESIPIDFVAGTSVGAVIGAAYCSGISAKELEEIAALVRFKTFARWTVSRLGFASNDRMTGFLEKVINARSFEELKIPLAVAATDFVTGDGVVFRSGPLVDAVRASCAYPGFFLPVSIDGRLLVDGMLSHVVPTRPLREMGADRVIGVYLSAHWVATRGPRHVFDVIGQCFSIAQQKMCEFWQTAADMVLEPDVTGFTYDAFDRAPELVRSGEAAARQIVPMLRQLIGAQPAATLDPLLQAKSPAIPPQPSPA